MVAVKVTVYWGVKPFSPVVPLPSSALTTEAAGFPQTYVTGVQLDIITSVNYSHRPSVISYQN